MAVGVQRRPAPASGTLTFLFTDIEGSTRLWEQHQHAMKEALERHDAILRAAVEGSGGEVVKTIGDGLMAVFDSAVEGLHASLTAQHALIDEPWGETGPLRVRMGLHAGEAAVREGDYFGPTLNRTARHVRGSWRSGTALGGSRGPGRGLAARRRHSAGPGRAPAEGPGPARACLPALLPRTSGQLPAAGHTQAPPQPSTQPSAFVGRRRSWPRSSVAAESVRLLTLTGPGGIGKTRLSLSAASKAIDRFEHGVFFVDLAAARDTESVLAAIASAIGLEATAAESLLDELRERLRDEHVLLILDNFEQVTQAASEVAQLLWDCPRLKNAGDEPRGVAPPRRASVRRAASLAAGRRSPAGLRRWACCV